MREEGITILFYKVRVLLSTILYSPQILILFSYPGVICLDFFIQSVLLIIRQIIHEISLDSSRGVEFHDLAARVNLLGDCHSVVE